jgi:hypothetical protein
VTTAPLDTNHWTHQCLVSLRCLWSQVTVWSASKLMQHSKAGTLQHLILQLARSPTESGPLACELGGQHIDALFAAGHLRLLLRGRRL